MDHPPPHSFSRSPVEEVFCRCSPGPDAKPLSLTFPPPYPGWPPIREEIRDMIAGAGDVSRIRGCMLRYTDLLPVAHETDVPGIGTVGDLIAGKFRCSIDAARSEIVISGTGIPNTAGSVRTIANRPGKPGWTLVFCLHTRGPAQFATGESVLQWFDDARAVIHGLFDLVVPGEIVQGLR